VWSPVEVFRVVEGTIVQRWGYTGGLVLARSLATQPIELPVPTPRVVTVMRATLAPGARWDIPRVEGPSLLYLESGILEVGSTRDDVQAAGAGAGVPGSGRVEAPERGMLPAGEHWLIPSEAAMSATNVGSAGAQLLAVTFSEPRIPNGAAPPEERLASGVTVEVLAGDLATSLGTATVTVTLERIALAPASEHKLSSQEGPILVAVEMGQLEATAWGDAWVWRSRNGMSVASQAATLTTENGMMLQPDGLVALRNGEPSPAQALVVTIQRASADRAP
jgi:hypothetical protein